MNQSEYFDSVKMVSVLHGVARIETQVATGKRDGDGKPELIDGAMLTTSLNGLIHLHANINELVKKLQEAGVLVEKTDDSMVVSNTSN